jgi:polycomb group RING finger protein 4
MVIAGESSLEPDPQYDDSLCALSTLLLECAKVNAAPQQMKGILKEQTVTDEVSNILVELYTQHQSNLAEHILMTGIAPPRIVDIDWRLDYNVRSKQGGRENKPLFFVSLRVKDRGIDRNIDMIASQNELQDWVSKTRDAVKQVERVLSATSEA